MAFNILGDAADLCFDSHFAPIQRFMQRASETLAGDITLARIPDTGYMLSLGTVSTLGEQYLHMAWDRLVFWVARRTTDDSIAVDLLQRHTALRLRDMPFPEDLITLSLQLPAFTAKAPRRAQR